MMVHIGVHSFRYTMLSTSPCKSRQIVAMLLVCMAVVTAIGCQFHTAPLEPMHADPRKHRHVSSTHSMLHSSCLTVVLSSHTLFALLLFLSFYAAPLSLKHALITSPPFRPPKNCLSLACFLAT